LMESAYPLWRELEREAGETLLNQCGGFFFGPEDCDDMAATEAALTEVCVPFERLSHLQAASRFPQFRLAADEYGVFEPESGFLRASRCVLANARGAAAHGAFIRTGAKIEALEPSTTGVRLRVKGEWETYHRVIVTAGPWTGALLSAFVTLPLKVTRQQYAHFRVGPDAGEGFSPRRFPVWIDMKQLFYGFPENADHSGAKVALHVPGDTFDPESPDRQPREADNETLRRYLADRLPGLTGEVLFEKVCLYTNSPDEDFIVDRLPGEPRVIFVGGLSGHGFKFTVLLGLIAARLVQDLDPGHSLERFSMRRFSS
jgi:sarcosine oxidase